MTSRSVHPAPVRTLISPARSSDDPSAAVAADRTSRVQQWGQSMQLYGHQGPRPTSSESCRPGPAVKSIRICGPGRRKPSTPGISQSAEVSSKP